MKRIYSLLIISAVFLSSIAIAQDNKSDARYLKLEKEYQLNEDGSMDFRLKKQLKLLTYYSFHRLYGETFVLYNPLFQELKVNSSYTIMADGKKVQTPPNAYNKLLPRFATNASDHNYLREMAITHTGLEKNAVINLDYSIHTNKDLVPVFSVTEFIGEQSPIDELIITIKIPKNKTALFELLNSEVTPEISEEGETRSYRWVFKELPAIMGNMHGANWETYAPTLFFSTLNNRDEFISTVLKQPAFEYKVNDKMRRKVESLKTDSKDDLDLALKIQKYVVNDFKVNNIGSKIIGYKYREANEVWESAYGTMMEKLILLTALIKTANLDVVPFVVISTVVNFDQICVPIIRDYLVRVKTKDGSTFFLYPDRINKQDAAYLLPDMTIVALSYQEILEVINKKSQKNNITIVGELNINTGGLISGDIEGELSYALNPYFDLKKNSGSAKRLIKGGVSASDCKSKVIESTAEKSTIEYKVESKDSLDKKENYMFFELPYLNNGIESQHIYDLVTVRTTPFKLPYALNETYLYEIELDEGMKLVNPNIKLEEKNEIGKVVIEIKASGSKVKVSRSISIYKHQIPVESYMVFRKLINLWNDTNYRKMVFKLNVE